MQIACFPNSYGRFGPEAAIRLLPQSGIHWLELPIKNAGVPSFFKETPLLTDLSTDAEIESAQAAIAAGGLQVCSCNITSGNPLEGDVLDRTLRKLQIARRFGVPLVVGGGGELSSDDQWPQLVENLKRIGNVAEECGITYCCETHPGVCQNAERMLELLERVNHPRIQVNFDTGNLFFYNEGIDLLQQMEQVIGQTGHVHLKDTNGHFKEWHFPALGDGGAVNFRAVRELLERHGFNGPCSLEIEGIEGEPPLTLDEHQRRVVRSVEHLRDCGYVIDP